jgi:hypothetical protein
MLGSNGQGFSMLDLSFLPREYSTAFRYCLLADQVAVTLPLH